MELHEETAQTPTTALRLTDDSLIGIDALLQTQRRSARILIGALCVAVLPVFYLAHQEWGRQAELNAARNRTEILTVAIRDEAKDLRHRSYFPTIAEAVICATVSAADEKNVEKAVHRMSPRLNVADDCDAHPGYRVHFEIEQAAQQDPAQKTAVVKVTRRDPSQTTRVDLIHLGRGENDRWSVTERTISPIPEQFWRAGANHNEPQSSCGFGKIDKPKVFQWSDCDNIWCRRTGTSL